MKMLCAAVLLLTMIGQLAAASQSPDPALLGILANLKGDSESMKAVGSVIDQYLKLPGKNTAANQEAILKVMGLLSYSEPRGEAGRFLGSIRPADNKVFNEQISLIDTFIRRGGPENWDAASNAIHDLSHQSLSPAEELELNERAKNLSDILLRQHGSFYARTAETLNSSGTGNACPNLMRQLKK